MTQEEAEAKLLKLARQMRAVCREYTGPGAVRLAVAICNGGNISLWNEFWGLDKDKPINKDENERKED